MCRVLRQKDETNVVLSTELKDNWGEMRGKIVSDEDFDVLFRQLADVNKKNLEVSSLLFLGKTRYLFHEKQS